MGEVHPRVSAVVLNLLNALLYMHHFKDPVSDEAYFLNIDRVSRNLKVGGGLIEPFKNPKISKFSNPSQTLDLCSSNSYLNGALL